MTAARLYRIASVVLVLFATLHSIGFRKVDPRWNADATVAAMKTTFQVQGQTRSYWDFFTAFGFFATGLLLFCAVLAWQLGGLPAETLARLKIVRWSFAGCFVALNALTWVYMFPAPSVSTALVALTLGFAAWK
jgi:hypothetical protein